MNFELLSSGTYLCVAATSCMNHKSGPVIPKKTSKMYISIDQEKYVSNNRSFLASLCTRELAVEEIDGD
jgi:hypothetical protein